jgi:protein-tyrosine-phosphatase
MKILFLCNKNRFRSKIASTVFNSLNKKRELYAEDAGVLLDSYKPEIDDNVREIMKQKGYYISGRPGQFSKNLLKKFEMLIIVANSIEESLLSEFHGRKFIWNIMNCDACDVSEIKKIVEEIENKVKELIRNIS